MKLNNMTKEELENASYDDLAYIILKEKGKKMKTADIFKMICDKLELSENAYMEQIGEFFTMLSTEKRFIQLEKGYWDLKENHKSEVDLDEIEDEEEIEEETEETTDMDSDMEEDIYLDETKDVDDDTEEDDLQDLVILDEENDSDL